jgi:chromosome condensin MukBEF ATPase and DNA-binding subunit MukB
MHCLQASALSSKDDEIQRLQQQLQQHKTVAPSDNQALRSLQQQFSQMSETLISLINKPEEKSDTKVAV